jgi:hypothetical protein
VLLLLAATLALLAAGCGGGGASNSASSPSQSFSSYETAMQQLGQSLGSAIRTAGNANINASAGTIADNLTKVQRLLRGAAVKLEKITPPDKVTAAHRLLITGVREYATELGGVITQLKHGNKAALGSVLTLKGIKDMQRASQSIQKAGYVIVTP